MRKGDTVFEKRENSVKGKGIRGGNHTRWGRGRGKDEGNVKREIPEMWKEVWEGKKRGEGGMNDK